MSSDAVVICEHCDTVHRRVALSRGGRARCLRCGAVLYGESASDVEIMLALTLAALVVFIIANAYPIVTIAAQGFVNRTTLLGAVFASYDSGIGPVAVLAALSVFGFPLLQLSLYLWVLGHLRAGRRPPGFVAAMHALRQLRPWSMVEVFLLGILVAVVKLAALARVTPEAGFWGFAALTILLTALNSFDPHTLWQRAAAVSP